jgi:cell division protein FtsB|tara:strand:+ start:301 stop:480 length:180 start_codon:yes stop_codon:yes gene_type:complete
LVNEELAVQQDFNEKLKERNRFLEVEVVDLKTGTEAIEERARFELGMIGEGETFYLMVD